MVLAAPAGASIIRAAAGNALSAPLLADVERNGQGVLGHVGLEAITADAAVGESFRFAGIAEDWTGGLLLADDGAVAQLVIAPRPSGEEVDSGRINDIVGRDGDDARKREEDCSEGDHFGGCEARANSTGCCRAALNLFPRRRWGITERSVEGLLGYEKTKQNNPKREEGREPRGWAR